MHRHLIETAVYFFFLEPARLELFLSLLWRENEVNDSGKITETFNHSHWKGLLWIFWSNPLMDEPTKIMLLRAVSN